MKAETYHQLKRGIAELLGCAPSTITPESTFDELGADSIDMLELEMTIETGFSIVVPDYSLTKSKTVREVAKIIDELTETEDGE